MNVNRTGRVSAIDYEAGTYEVTYFDRGKSVTRKINAVSNGEYKMPEIGQMVSVCHNSNGTGAAVAVGTVWNRTNKPVEGFKGLFRKEYGLAAGKAFERYDDNTGVYVQCIDNRSGRSCNGDIVDEAKKNLSLSAEKMLALASEEKLNFETSGEMVINSAGDGNVFCGGKITFNAEKGGEITLKGEVTLDINGVKLTVSESGEIKVVSSQKMDVEVQEINFSAKTGKIVVEGRTL